MCVIRHLSSSWRKTDRPVPPSSKIRTPWATTQVRRWHSGVRARHERHRRHLSLSRYDRADRLDDERAGRYSVRLSDGARWQGESNSLHCISVLRKSDRPQKMTNSRKCYCLEFSECFQNTSRLSVIQSVRRPISEKKPQADQRLGVICVIEWE